MKTKDITTLIKQLRRQLGLTQEQFARKVGVTCGTVNHWENEKRTPHPYLIHRLLEIKKELSEGKGENPKKAGKS
jgi:putative transcriptional regulator